MPRPITDRLNRGQLEALLALIAEKLATVPMPDRLEHGALITAASALRMQLAQLA